MVKKGNAIRVIILGAGGHAKVIADILLNPILKNKGFNFIGFMDDNPVLFNKFILDKPVLGSLEDLKNVPHDAVVIGIGDNGDRCHLFDLLSSRGEKFATIIHPSAVIAPDVKIGVGTVVFAGVVINTGADIKDNVILNTGCTVDHDCIVESHSHICPGAHLGGNVRVEKGAWIGIGSTVLHSINIGEWATVGGGATVINDILSNTTVVGIPAKALPKRLSKHLSAPNIYINTQHTRQMDKPSEIVSSESKLQNCVQVGNTKSNPPHREEQQAIANVNILFTSVGRRVELLWAFRNAYKSLGLSGHIVALDIDSLAPGLFVADRSYLAPSLSSRDYIPLLVSICRKEQIRLVFPLIDPDIPLLAEHRDIIEQSGAEVVVLSKESVAITKDKWLTKKFFDRIDVPIPHSWLPEDLDPETALYPLFVKPRCGSAGKGSFKVENADQLRFFVKYIQEPIIQEFLPGPEITNDVICDLKGKVLAVVSRERIEVRSGEVSKGITIYNEKITNTCIKIAKALGGKGQITIQCIMKNGAPYFTEINARFGGGTPLGIASGCDAPRWLLAQAAGLPVDVPPIGSYKLGLHVTRFDDSFFLTEPERGRIARGSL